MYQNLQSVYKQLGKEITIGGVAHNSKMQPLLELPNGDILSCQFGAKLWPEEMVGKRIHIKGVVTETSISPLPIAKQNEKGAWSQGQSIPHDLQDSAAFLTQLCASKTIVFVVSCVGDQSPSD